MGLLEKPEVHQVVTANMMRVGHRLLTPADERAVAGLVQAGFRNASLALQEGAPELARELEMIQLSDPQMDAVLTSLQLLSDRRVQRVGLNVARAVRGAGSEDRDVIKRHLSMMMLPLAGEIRRLREELVPLPLLQLWGSGHEWDMTLDLENIQVMGRDGSRSGTDFMELPSADLRQTSAGVEIGVLEQSRAMIDMLRQMASLFGHKAAIPPWVSSLAGKVDMQDLSCELASVDLNARDLMKAWFCPLKFGSQGVDAMRAIADMPQHAPLSLFEVLGDIGAAAIR